LGVNEKDSLSTSILEELVGNKFIESNYTPHRFHFVRQRFLEGMSSPDDVRIVHMASFNRKHRYKERYMDQVGTDMLTMTTY